MVKKGQNIYILLKILSSRLITLPFISYFLLFISYFFNNIMNEGFFFKKKIIITWWMVKCQKKMIQMSFYFGKWSKLTPSKFLYFWNSLFFSKLLKEFFLGNSAKIKLRDWVQNIKTCKCHMYQFINKMFILPLCPQILHYCFRNPHIGLLYKSWVSKVSVSHILGFISLCNTFLCTKS